MKRRTANRLGWVMALGFLFAAAAAAGEVSEYQVKAAFLFNFARFVEWPADSFKSPKDPMTVCVLGQDPFEGALEQAVNGKTVEGRPFLVRQVSDVSARGCQILFVSAAERQRFRSNAGDQKASGVLTVGESQGFAADGGVMNFKLVDGKVRIEVNLAAAEQGRLRISSKLLSLADIVKK